MVVVCIAYFNFSRALEIGAGPQMTLLMRMLNGTPCARTYTYVLSIFVVVCPPVHVLLRVCTRLLHLCSCTRLATFRDDGRVEGPTRWIQSKANSSMNRAGQFLENDASNYADDSISSRSTTSSHSGFGRRPVVKSK